MSRKLASIQVITDIKEIPGADKIVMCQVLGWQCVIAKKDNLSVGDKVIYIEVDSVLPDKPQYEFLRERKFRIKTIRLKGQISQGLVLPLLQHVCYNQSQTGKFEVGEDVTELLGITKYETPTEKNERVREELKAGRIKKLLMRYSWFRKFIYKPAKADFPKFIKKTDEDRIQLFPNICEEHKDIVFSVTEKLDGQSATYFIVKQDKKWFEFWKDKYVFGVCSRNFHLLKEDNSTWWTVARQFKMKEKLTWMIKETNSDYFVVQGEIIGEGVQGNKYNIKGLDFYKFNMFNSETIYENLEVEGIKNVPILDTKFVLKPTIQENVEYAKGKSTLIDVLREGVVVRNYEKNVSFKIINPEFLIKWDL